MHAFYMAFAGTGSLGPTVKTLMAFVFLIICMALVSVIINTFARGAAQITGRVAGAPAGLSEGLKKMRGAKAQKSFKDFKQGERFNPNSRATRLLGGNVLNAFGSHVGAGASGNFGLGRKGAATLAANRASSKEEMSRENAIFGRFAEDESTMLAVAAGNDAAFLRTFQQFQGPNGRENLRTAMGNASAIMAKGGGRRLEYAGADAVSKSGKGLFSPDEQQRLARHVSSDQVANTLRNNRLTNRMNYGNGNEALYNMGLYSNLYNARSSGNFAAGRTTFEESLRELGNQGYSTVKEGAARELFTTNGTGDSVFTRVIADLRTREAEAIANGDAAAVRTARSRRMTMFDQLAAARDNPATPASSKLFINQTINSVAQATGSDNQLDWMQARERQTMGSTLGKPIVFTGTTPIDSSTGGRVA